MKELIRLLKQMPKIGIVSIKAWSTRSVYTKLTFPEGKVRRTIRLSNHYKEGAKEDIQIIFKKIEEDEI